MGDVSYKPIIDQMVWSYSRVDTFDSCHYKWFMRYILGIEEDDMFYASYGSFMHELIEQHYRGEIDNDELVSAFLIRFSSEVKGERPSESIVKKYIDSAVEYLRNFKQFDCNMIDVEHKVEFEIDGIKMIGFIDYIGEKDGDIYIIDHKSRDLKPRSNKSKPTAKDAELDDMLKQLYIYSEAVRQEFGKFPKYLCFNCFRSGVFIRENFNNQKYDQAMKWLKETINDISNADDFDPNVDYFFCRNICGMNKYCEYHQAMVGKSRR